MGSNEITEEERLRQIYDFQKEETQKKLEQYERDMNKIIVSDYILLIVAIVLFIIALITPRAHAYGEVHPYNPNWYIRSDKSEWANRDRKTFDPPAVGIEAKEPNKLQRILYRANKRHVIPYNRYITHISDREYTDCTYYKYVDCSNLAFCRCWQCRDYVYPYVRVEY